MVIARHIWEHTFDPAGFLDAMRELATADGRIVLEVPDCERSLAGCDYTTVWEEHTAYFTPATFCGGIQRNGLAICHFEVVPYSLENSLVAVVGVASKAAHNRSKGN